MPDLVFSAGFVCFGTRVLFRSNEPALLAKLVETARSALLGNLTEAVGGDYPLTIDLIAENGEIRLERNNSYISRGDPRQSDRFLNAAIRVSIAEFAPELVFLHAGAVSWRGKGIVLPADSFTGKSTFVAELVKRGAEYYSDDFAIIDRNGLLHPFPRQISMRTREPDYSVYEVDPTRIGGAVGRVPCPIAMVLLSRYKRRGRWAPRRLSIGDGLLRMIPFALGMSQRPGGCISTLQKVLSNATVIETERGEADRAALKLMDFFDRQGF